LSTNSPVNTQAADNQAHDQKPTLKPARQQKHLAVLIDANKSIAAIVDGLFEEIAKAHDPA